MKLPPEIMTTLFIGWTFFGAIVGSFLNAFIYRWPRKISMVKRSRSFCPRCEKLIRWYDNIPILSFLILRGKCRSCKRRIHPRYLFVEILTSILFAVAFYQGIANSNIFTGGVITYEGLALTAMISLFGALMLAISFVDIETYTIPIICTNILLVLGLLGAILGAGWIIWPDVFSGISWLDVIINSVEGIILGGGIVWLTGAAAELLVRREAMGGGDVAIMAGVGAVLGPKAAIAIFFLSSFPGALFGILTIAYQKLFLVDEKNSNKNNNNKKKKKGITYSYEPDEELPPSDKELVKSHALLIFGFSVAVLHFLLLFFDNVWTSLSTILLLLFGVALGAFMCLYDIIRRRLVNEDRWIARDIATSSDGKTEEHLDGHYLPFGPFLCMTALVVLLLRENFISYIDKLLG